MRNSKKTTTYESRNSIARKNKVNQMVSRVVAGLGGYGDATEDLVNSAEIDNLVDKYYQPEEYPAADALTEMMGWESPKYKTAAIGTAILLLAGLYFYCR